jgi:hypothetical protein
MHWVGRGPLGCRRSLIPQLPQAVRERAADSILREILLVRKNLAADLLCRELAATHTTRATTPTLVPEAAGVPPPPPPPKKKTYVGDAGGG